MAQEGNTPTTSRTEGAGANEGSGQRRKIGGKYDSVEDAVEELIRSRDEAYHETRSELGAIKQLLERTMTPIGDRGDGYRSRDDDYNRGRSQQEEDIDAAEFLTTPGKVLQRREAKLRAEFKREQEQRTAAIVGNAATVLRFQMKNPDLDEHEDLVSSFLNRQPTSDPLSTRLNNAAKATRQYLARIKGGGDGDDDGIGGGSGRAPNSDEYVEGVAGSRNGNGGGSRQRLTAEEQEAKDEEARIAAELKVKAQGDQEMAEYLQERKNFRTARFQAPQK